MKLARGWRCKPRVLRQSSQLLRLGEGAGSAQKTKPPAQGRRRSFFGRPWRGALAVLVCGGLLLQACGEQDRSQPPAPELAPPFTLALFQGGSFTLAEQRGKVVVINFFASWCISCGEESPMIERVAKEYQPKGVAFLAVAVDDTEQKARAYLQKAGLNIAAGLDQSGKIKEAYGIYGMPTTFFIDQAGRIRYMHAGAIGEQLMRHEIDKLQQTH